MKPWMKYGIAVLVGVVAANRIRSFGPLSKLPSL